MFYFILALLLLLFIAALRCICIVPQANDWVVESLGR